MDKKLVIVELKDGEMYNATLFSNNDNLYEYYFYEKRGLGYNKYDTYSGVCSKFIEIVYRGTVNNLLMVYKSNFQ